MEKLKIDLPIIVEGKYDKIKVLSVADACVVQTDGFGVFKNHERLALIKQLAKKSRIILLTDSDGAGKVIRSHITSAIPKDRLIQLYIPRIEGKEKRKDTPSAEGTLGVEGMERELLRSLLCPFVDDSALKRAEENPISKADMYADGLSGREDSAQRRDALAQKLGLPPSMTANALLAALKILVTYDEYCSLVGRK